MLDIAEYLSTISLAIIAVIALISPVCVAWINSRAKRVELIASQKLEAYADWYNLAATLINSSDNSFNDMFFALLQGASAAYVLADAKTSASIDVFTQQCRAIISQDLKMSDWQKSLLDLCDIVLKNMNTDVNSSLKQFSIMTLIRKTV